MKKLEFYVHLRELGIKEAVALSMARQSSASGRGSKMNVEDAVADFTDWDTTHQGGEYWSSVYRGEVDITEDATS